MCSLHQTIAPLSKPSPPNVAASSRHAQALGAGVNGDAALIISNMAAEPDCGPNTVLRNTNLSAWEAAVTAALAGWPNAAAFTAAVLGTYAAEAAVDPQLAFDSLASDYGLTCGNAALATAAVATGRRRAPTYLMYNAWPRRWGLASGCSGGFARHYVPSFPVWSSAKRMPMAPAAGRVMG